DRRSNERNRVASTLSRDSHSHHHRTLPPTVPRLPFLLANSHSNLLKGIRSSAAYARENSVIGRVSNVLKLCLGAFERQARSYSFPSREMPDWLKDSNPIRRSARRSTALEKQLNSRQAFLQKPFV